MRRVSLVLAALLIAGCASASKPGSHVGRELPAAYAPFIDSAPEQGGLRSHAAVITQRDVVVYRLYDGRPPGAAKVAQKMGVYWTDFTVASEAQARDQLAVCKGWNDMARVVTCTLLKGSTVVWGPGQDANCAVLPNSGSTAYHPGGAPQLFISNPSVLLTGCTDASTGW